MQLAGSGQKYLSSTVDKLFKYFICRHIECLSSDSRDRIVVSTSRCGRDNPGSNPGHGICCDRRCHGTAVQTFFLFFYDLKSSKNLSVKQKRHFCQGY